MPLLDAFSDFLLQGRADFTWSEPQAPIRLAAVQAEVLKAAEADARTHVSAADRTVDERRCPSCLRELRAPRPAAAAARPKVRGASTRSTRSAAPPPT